ncbi:ATP-binding protein [Salinarchaeum chitinilyticum]
MTLENVESTEGAILAAVSAAVLVTDRNGRIVYQSPSVSSAFGYETDALVGRDTAALVHDDDREAIGDLVDRIEPGGTERAEVRIADADGAWRWAAVTVTDPVDTAIDGFVISARDVTEQVHARWDREELLDRMAEAFFAVDTEWRVTHVNRHTEALLDVDECDVVGIELDELFPAGLGSTFDEQFREAVATDEPRQFEAYYEPLDAWFAVAAYPGETGLSVFFEDVTDRKRTEMAVAKNEKALRDLHDVAADKGLAFEEKLVRLLDLGRDRLDLRLGFLTRIEETEDGEGVQRVIACQGDHDLLVRGESCPLSQAYCQRTIETDELMATRDPQGEWVPEEAYDAFGLETYVGGKLLVDGEIYGTLCFADTEPREHPFRSDEEAFVELLVEWMAYELERERRETRLERQNDRLDAFASMVSHDLRNPLTIAQGNLDLARESGDSDSFEAVTESLDRMERLIDDMLWLAREGQDVADTAPVDLQAVADEAWNFVATPSATLTVDCEGCTIDADHDRLLQLLENCFRNAIDHSDGEVVVRVGCVENGFYVEDDGPGIQPEERDDVFETGFTTDEEGTGFGLAIVQRIAAAHGWSVTAAESADGGARFEFVAA